MNERPSPREIGDLGALRLLAHPLRYRIAQVLRGGPATSTTLARALGLNTGATSYHLRQMARHEFIEEVPEEELPRRSHGRERWWRARRMDLRMPGRSQQTAEVRAVVDEIARLDLAADVEELARFQLERDQMGEWGDALPVSRGSVRVTHQELRQFFEEYLDLLYRYKRSDEDTPPGARDVSVRFTAIPTPGATPHQGGGEHPAPDP